MKVCTCKEWFEKVPVLDDEGVVIKVKRKQRYVRDPDCPLHGGPGP